ncbi:MAG: threonyl-tRNA synthetase editing domain-containing protein [Candidatus Altiarchaeota archaeon]
MRLLFIHADRMWYKAGRKTKYAEELEKNREEAELRDCLVVFTCVEHYDEEKPGESAETLYREIKKTLTNLKEDRLFLFPFAHLSKSLSKPDTALTVLKKVEEKCIKDGITVVRAPFGWNKKFSLDSKGHPMAVSSKSFCPIMAECRNRCPHCDGPLAI